MQVDEPRKGNKCRQDKQRQKHLAFGYKVFTNVVYEYAQRKEGK